MLSSPEINALGQVLNSSWGYSSTERGNFPLGTAPHYSLKGHIVGDTQPDEKSDLKMVLTYTTIITFNSEMEVQAHKRRYAQEAEAMMKQWVSRIKKEFKDAADRSLKLKQVAVEPPDNLQVIYTQPTGGSYWIGGSGAAPIKRAYYRYTCIFNVK